MISTYSNDLILFIMFCRLLLKWSLDQWSMVRMVRHYRCFNNVSDTWPRQSLTHVKMSCYDKLPFPPPHRSDRPGSELPNCCSDPTWSETRVLVSMRCWPTPSRSPTWTCAARSTPPSCCVEEPPWSKVGVCPPLGLRTPVLQGSFPRFSVLMYLSCLV